MHSVVPYSRLETVNNARVLDAVLEELNDVVVLLLDQAGCGVSWNPGIERILGYTEREWLGHSVGRIYTAKDTASGVYEGELGEASRSGRAPSARWYLRKSGEPFYAEGATIALREDRGPVSGFSKVMRDVTTRQLNEERNAFLIKLDDALRPLTDPHEMMHIATRLLGEHLHVDRCGYCTFAPDQDTFEVAWDYCRPGTISIVGRYSLAQFGAESERLLRANLPIVVEDIDTASLENEARESFRHTGILAHVSVPLHKRGQLVAAIGAHHGQPRHWRPDEVELVHLVTSRCWESLERASVAGESRRQWQVFDAALAHTPDFLHILDLHGCFIYANRALLSFWQKSLEQVVGKSFFDLGYPPALANRLQDQFRQVLTTGESVIDRTSFALPSGESREYEYIYSPIFGEDREVNAVVGTTRDITEHKRAQEELQQSEQCLRALVTASSNVLFRMSLDWAEMRLLSGQDFLPGTQSSKRNWLDECIHPVDKQRVLAAIGKAVGEKSLFELEHRVWRMDGTMGWTLSRAVPLLDKDGEITEWFGSASDVTARRQAEEALRESEQRLASALQAGELGAWELDLTTEKAWRSPLHDQIFGYKTFLPDWSYRLFLEHVHPEDRAAVDLGFRQARSNGGNWSFACRIRRADGVERWISAQGKMDLDVNNQPVRMKGTVRDISERKKAEEDLRRSYEELEEFAYVASHDLQEPLRMVSIYTQLILNGMGESKAALNEYGNFVRDGVKRMEELIRDLLTYSRTVHHEPQPIGTADLSRSLREAVSVLQNRIEESGAEIIAAHLPVVSGDTKQMAHVFQNLLSNALKYRRRDLAPRIEIAAERENSQWLVSVRDNGIGFEPQYSQRIFGLFKRLHADEYPGTGLGLAICHRIIQRYGGRLWAEGRPGHGATFFFALPACEE